MKWRGEWKGRHMTGPLAYIAMAQPDVGQMWTV